MEKEYIEREALLSLETIMVDPEGFEHSCVLSVDVRSAPAADVVEVVHGRWVDNVDENGALRNAWRKCSACGGLNFSKRPPYCPNCGARMDGE